jgi:hypothetical protein
VLLVGVKRNCTPGLKAYRQALPGTELKKLLAWFGIVANNGCKCNDMAAEIDRKGVEWCASNIDTIVGWLREQADSRGLPFIELAARLLIRRAIRNARKASA